MFANETKGTFCVFQPWNPSIQPKTSYQSNLRLNQGTEINQNLGGDVFQGKLTQRVVGNEHIPYISFEFLNFAIVFKCEVNEKRRINELKRPYFFNASHMLGRTPNESKKLLALVSNNLHTTGAILVSVIKRPKNKNFVTAISVLKVPSSIV